MSTSDKSSSRVNHFSRRQFRRRHYRAAPNAYPKVASGSATKEPSHPILNSLHCVDARFPWLKIALVCFTGFVAVLDLLDFTISGVGESYTKISVAPMSKHVRVTERVLEGKMLVALTFDDGPSSETTPRLLDILRDRDVPETFFELGYMARSNPNVVSRVAKEGHEIASHTMYHQNLSRISADAVQADIAEANAVFNDILGRTPTLTRPPYGNINDAVRAYVGTPMILWSVDTLDWRYKNTESIVGITMDEISDGAIILMHDIHPTSVDAVPTLIDTVRNAGYEFVTVSELARIRGTSLETGAAYRYLAP